jgi:hypothetical protein
MGPLSRQLRAVVRMEGGWLPAALLLGAAARLYLLLYTEGSFDVAIKQHHGTQVSQWGLLEYYRRAEVFNHPPLMGALFAGLVKLSAATGAPFRLLLRLPFACLDLGTALLLRRAFRDSGWSRSVLAAYWLHPLALIFSAYHGNTDTAVAFACLAALLLAAGGRPVAAGAALGVGLWVKLPALLAAPALCLAFPAWRERARFAAGAAAVAGLGYLPWMAAEPGLLFQRIFAYPGSGVETPRGIAIWGLAHVLRFDQTSAGALLAEHNRVVVWLPVLALAWLRRGRERVEEMGAGVCGAFLVLYGFTSHWAWQYLAWSLPFWFFLGWRFTGAATAVIGAYVYGVYALFTGSPWLQGRWDFVGHASWPPLLTGLRDASVLLCGATACWLLVRSVLDARRPPAGAGA